jgi:hypothetical protein
MKNIWIDKLKPQDAEESTRYLCGTDNNLLDPAVLTYPATEVLKAYNSEKNILYLPLQFTYILESLGLNPEASPGEVASGLRALMQVIAFEAKCRGMGELYFGCKDEKTIAFAEHHGFEEVPFRMFRLKL